MKYNDDGSNFSTAVAIPITKIVTLGVMRPPAQETVTLRGR